MYGIPFSETEKIIFTIGLVCLFILPLIICTYQEIQFRRYRKKMMNRWR